jgi:hypothetical protein
MTAAALAGASVGSHGVHRVGAGGRGRAQVSATTTDAEAPRAQQALRGVPRAAEAETIACTRTSALYCLVCR